MNAAEINALPVGTHIRIVDDPDETAQWVRLSDGWHLIDQATGRDWSDEGRSAEYLLADEAPLAIVAP